MDNVGITFVTHKDKIKSSKYSVYELWVAGESNPFYVGKGLNGRPYSHLKLARNENNKDIKSNKIRKAWEMDLPIIIKHIFRTDIEEEAFDEEKRLIALYGRRDNGTGVLVNFTDGGEGSSGAIYSEETRRKASERMKGNKRGVGHVVSEETCQKISLANRGNKTWLGKTHSEETRKKMSQSKNGIEISENHRRKISVTLTGRVLSEDHRQNISKSLKGKQAWNLGISHSEETRLKMRKARARYEAVKIQTRKNLATLNEILSLEEK
jgi:hypothetical protein